MPIEGTMIDIVRGLIIDRHIGINELNLLSKNPNIDFEEEYIKKYGLVIDEKDVIEFLTENIKYLDKDKVHMTSYYILGYIDVGEKREITRNRIVDELMKRINSIKKDKIIVVRDYISNKVVISSSNKILKKKSKLDDNSLADYYFDKHNFDYIVNFIEPMDIYTNCKAEDKCILKYITKMHENYLRSILDDEVLNESKDEAWKEYKEAQMSFIYKFSSYMDWDKLMLTQAYRIKEFLEEEKAHDEQLSIEIIDKIYKEIKQKGKNITANVINIDTKKTEAVYSISDLEKDLNKVVNGKYISRKYIERTMEKLKTNELLLEDVKEEIKLFPKEKIMEIAKETDQDVLTIVEICNLDKEDILEIIKTRTDISSEDVAKLYIDGKLENLRKLYEEEIISLDVIRKIKEKDIEKQTNLQDEVNEKELIELYKKANSSEASIEDKREFNKYMRLYKMIKVKGNKDKNTLKENADKIIMEFGDTFDEKVLEDLYKLELFPFTTVLEWANSETIENILTSGYMRPVEVKDALLTGDLDEKILINILQNNNIEHEEKMNILLDLFSDISQEDLEMFNKYSKYLKIEEEKNGKTRKVSKKGNNSNSSSRKFATEPYARLAIIRTLDKDVSIQHKPNGFAILKLPNVQNGIVIIEKILNKGSKDVYGFATYALDEEDYEKVSMLPINRELLSDLKQKNLAGTMSHSKEKWIKQLLALAGIKEFRGKLVNINDEKSSHTKEELEQLEKIVKLVRESRREI